MYSGTVFIECMRLLYITSQISLFSVVRSSLLALLFNGQDYAILYLEHVMRKTATA